MFLINNKNRRKHIVDNDGNLINRGESGKLQFKRKPKPIRIVFLVVMLLVLSIFSWLGAGAYSNIGKIITKNQENGSPILSFLGNIKPENLKNETDERINILLLGIGGSNHPGGLLADTIMVVSLSPKDKSIAMLSIPRDLYVAIPGYGNAKINSAHSTGEQYKDKTGGGPSLVKRTVADILDLPIHYYLRIDFSGFVKFVDTIGGISIDVPKAINDPYYPDEYMEGYEPFSIKAGYQNLNGETALKYARSRETTSDFDRAKRQQLILEAVREKTLSLGVLANPKKMNDILKILGDHLRTDMQIKESEKFFSLLKDINSSKIINKVLDTGPEGLLTNSPDLGGYYLIPKEGNGDFSQIQSLAHQIFSSAYLSEEKAKIEVFNASKNPGIAKEVSELLKNYGYNVVSIGDSNQSLSQTIIYDYSDGKKPFTIQFLSNRFAARAQKQPTQTDTKVDIKILLGDDYKKQ